MINHQALQTKFISKTVNVLGSDIHYVVSGEGDPILFLHGIPASSYTWRHMIPYLAPLGRCIAPDLIGFGQSVKPDIQYSLFDHIKYITQFIETLELKNLTLVMHGWGSIIGFHYAMQHEQNCKGLIFYEAFLPSLEMNALSLPFQEHIQTLHNKTSGNLIDKFISQRMMHSLNDYDLNQYRQPFLGADANKPLIQYLHELTNKDELKKINQVVTDYSKKLTRSALPKLMLYSVPGFITTMANVIWMKKNLTHLEMVEIGEEFHFAQESQPQLMAETMSAWLQGIDIASGVFV